MIFLTKQTATINIHQSGMTTTNCFSCRKALRYRCGMCGRRLCDGCVHVCTAGCFQEICEDHMYNSIKCKNCQYLKELSIENK
jgi:hypothetical protein